MEKIMPKEIKFRGYSLKHQKYLYSPDYNYVDIEEKRFGNIGYDFEFNYIEDDEKLENLEQFTGSKDKYDKDIFEGDLLITSIYTGLRTPGLVIFEQGCFWPFQLDYVHGEDFEIIGNIYENPELVKR